MSGHDLPAYARLMTLPVAVVWLWIADPNTRRPARRPAWLGTALAGSIALLALHTAVPVALFGPVLAAQVRDPFLTVLSATSVPGLGSPRAVYLSGPAWLTGLIALAALHAHATAAALGRVLTGGKRPIGSLPAALARLLPAVWLSAVAFAPIDEPTRRVLSPLAGWTAAAAALLWLMARWATAAGAIEGGGAPSSGEPTGR